VPNTEGGQAASFSPDGRWIIFDKPDERTPSRSHVYAIRVDGRGRRRLTNGSGEGEASWSPDGTRIIYACATHPEDNGNVDPGGIPHAVCEISEKHPIPRTLFADPTRAVTDPTWNADGSKILVTLGGQIALLSPAGGKPVVITHPPGTAWAPDW
jgi:Tol biopolymer transport system component